jgi:exodeoxyribonuclease VII large subunit
MATRVNDRTQHFGALEHRLHRTHPGVRLQQLGQRIDELDVRMRSRIVNELATGRAELAAATLALRAAAPRARIDRLRERCRFSHHALAHAIGEHLASVSHRLATAARALESVSPLATLARGYAIATQRDTGALVTDAGDVGKGTDVTIRVHRGRFNATVSNVERDE